MSSSTHTTNNNDRSNSLKDEDKYYCNYQGGNDQDDVEDSSSSSNSSSSNNDNDNDDSPRATKRPYTPEYEQMKNLSSHHHQELFDSPPPPSPPFQRSSPVARSTSSDHNDTSSFEELISSRMNEVSLEDRSSGLHDIHGVGDEDEEPTGQVLQEKLHELTFILDGGGSSSSSSIHHDLDTIDKDSSSSEDNNIKLAYQKAKSMSPNYIEKLKMLCLRSERFQPKEAARRLIRFCSLKLELWGESKLTSDITLQDLEIDPNCNEALNRGAVQILPLRDRSGRALIFFHGQTLESYSNETMMKLIVYMAMTALQDTETQRRGVVGIGYCIGQTKIHPGRAKALWIGWNAIPWKMVAYHMCKDSSLLDFSLKAFCAAIESRSVCRLRFHQGSNIECIYNLLTFGIPKEALPVSFDDASNMDLTNHRIMLESIACREQLQQQRARRHQVITSTVAAAVSAATAINLGLTSDAVKDNMDVYSNRSALDTSNRSAMDTSNRSAMDTSYGGTSCSQSSVSSTYIEPTTSYDVTTGTAGNMILVPGPMDIIMGRGRRSKFSRPGPSRFHHLLLEHYQKYDDAVSKADKKSIVNVVLSEMKSSGCRFLKKQSEGGMYMACDDTTAREKISHGFRNIRLEMNNNNNSNTTATKTSKSKKNKQGSETNKAKKRSLQQCQQQQSGQCNFGNM